MSFEKVSEVLKSIFNERRCDVYSLESRAKVIMGGLDKDMNKKSGLCGCGGQVWDSGYQCAVSCACACEGACACKCLRVCLLGVSL